MTASISHHVGPKSLLIPGLWSSLFPRPRPSSASGKGLFMFRDKSVCGSRVPLSDISRRRLFGWQERWKRACFPGPSKLGCLLQAWRGEGACRFIIIIVTKKGWKWRTSNSFILFYSNAPLGGDDQKDRVARSPSSALW